MAFSCATHKKNIPEKLEKLFRQFSIPESEQNTVDCVAELLSTKKLRNELKIIFKKIDYNFSVLDSLSQWKQFIGCICSELLNKFLEIKNIIDILDKPWGFHEYLLPKRLVLVNEGNQILFEIQIYSIMIDVNGKSSDETSTEVKVRGNFPLDENRENFLKD